MYQHAKKNSFVDSFDHIPIWQLKVLQVLHQLCRVQGFSPVTVSKSLWYYTYIILHLYTTRVVFAKLLSYCHRGSRRCYASIFWGSPSPRRRRHCQVATPLPKPWQKQRPKAKLPLPPRRRGRKLSTKCVKSLYFFFSNDDSLWLTMNNDVWIIYKWCTKDVFNVWLWCVMMYNGIMMYNDLSLCIWYIYITYMMYTGLL